MRRWCRLHEPFPITLACAVGATLAVWEQILVTRSSNPSFRWLTCPRCGAAVLDDTSDPKDSAHDRRCRSLRLRLKRFWARLPGARRIPSRRVAERWYRRAEDTRAIDVARGTTDRIDDTLPPVSDPASRWIRGWGNLRDRE